MNKKKTNVPLNDVTRLSQNKIKETKMRVME